MVEMKFWRGVWVGCTHAQLMLPQAYDALETVFDKWKPKVIGHLGDFLDTTALRDGADGTKDEGADIGLDFDAGFRFLNWYFRKGSIERILALGNHDDPRWEKWMGHPNAVKRHMAELLQDRAEREYKRMRLTHVLPYDIKRGWLKYSGAWFGHGYIVSQNALKATAEMLGGVSYTAHLHRIEEKSGETIEPSMSRCIGWLGDEYKAGYARRRRATLAWSNGFILTEHNGKETHAWQIRMDESGKFRMPF